MPNGKNVPSIQHQMDRSVKCGNLFPRRPAGHSVGDRDPKLSSEHRPAEGDWRLKQVRPNRQRGYAPEDGERTAANGHEPKPGAKAPEGEGHEQRSVDQVVRADAHEHRGRGEPSRSPGPAVLVERDHGQEGEEGKRAIGRMVDRMEHEVGRHHQERGFDAADPLAGEDPREREKRDNSRSKNRRQDRPDEHEPLPEDP